MKNYEFAVTVGRFQVADLHYAHIKILYDMMVAHKQILIFIGVSPAIGTERNPLDFQSRKKMLEKQFPNVVIKPIYDQGSDELWSANLDKAIEETFKSDNVLVYGGRDSFLPHYKGKFDTKEFEKINHFPGTEVRQKIGKTVKDSAEWREGQIYVTQNQYPRTFFTVDVAPIDFYAVDGKIRVLLAKKKSSDLFRFVGGFVDPTDASLEFSAQRELYEETDLLIDRTEFKYIKSIKIDDWRYRNSKDGIITSFFMCNADSTKPAYPKDDICYLEWVELTDEKLNTQMVGEHLNLLRDLKIYIKQQGELI